MMTGEVQGGALSAIAGRLNVTVKYDGKVIQEVLIRSTRPKELTRLLEGKAPEEAFYLIPLLFSLCGSSQTVAAAMAIESLRGVKVSKEIATLRSVLIYLETAKELALRLSKDWLKDDSVIDVLGLIACYQSALNHFSFALTLQDAHQKPVEEACYLALLERLEEILLPLTLFCEQSRVCDKAEESKTDQQLEVLAGLAHYLNERFEGVELGVACKALRINPEYVRDKLESDEASLFCAQPYIQVNGVHDCAETGVWSRNEQSTYICTAKERGDHQVTLRFLALVHELAMIPEKIRLLIKGSGEQLVSCLSSGLIRVNAARGELIHNVSLERVNGCEKIKSYHIIAPTEWNFHPAGSLVSMLQGAVISKEHLMLLIDKLILAIDPCVAYDIKIEE